MRHRKNFYKLKRKRSHRKCLLSNLAYNLIKYKIIRTTLIKAKSLRQYLEPILTKSKINTINNIRLVLKYLKNKVIINYLFNKIGPIIKKRNGGYLRIIKTNNRIGDNSKMALIMFVDKIL
ncbi:MAG: 50S ribosomal protein L17 [Candidatus Shikimatogenerans sp. AspAUS03]|uniref:50S ribosomal protein L17 n=1 Tax=Candidatus Shikimatogenerans sp. AspAUS03 TaxID=3158563 RepID=A0AAU7QS67_9FLAO